MELSILKVHGSGNDFFLIDEEKLERKMSEKEIISLGKSLCHRKTGLLSGADGLLLVQKAGDEGTLGKMRVINSDGSEASMCGNGLRTVARYISEQKQINAFKVETMHADLKVRKAKDLAPNVRAFQVEISPVSFLTDAVPMKVANQETIINQKIPLLSKTLDFSVVAVPNPHLIAFVDEEVFESDEQERIAKMVNQKNDLFPEGVNVSFVKIIAKQELYVRTYERGVGFTNACGTAMCASSLMYTLLHQGQFNKIVTVNNPGGLVKTVVHQDQDGSYWMELIGNATVTHQIADSFNHFFEGNYAEAIITKTEEEVAYQKWLADID